MWWAVACSFSGGRSHMDEVLLPSCQLRGASAVIVLWSMGTEPCGWRVGQMWRPVQKPVWRCETELQNGRKVGLMQRRENRREVCNMLSLDIFPPFLSPTLSFYFFLFLSFLGVSPCFQARSSHPPTSVTGTTVMCYHARWRLGIFICWFWGGVFLLCCQDGLMSCTQVILPTQCPSAETEGVCYRAHPELYVECIVQTSFYYREPLDMCKERSDTQDFIFKITFLLYLKKFYFQEKIKIFILNY